MGSCDDKRVGSLFSSSFFPLCAANQCTGRSCGGDTLAVVIPFSTWKLYWTVFPKDMAMAIDAKRLGKWQFSLCPILRSQDDGDYGEEKPSQPHITTTGPSGTLSTVPFPIESMGDEDKNFSHFFRPPSGLPPLLPISPLLLGKVRNRKIWRLLCMEENFRGSNSSFVWACWTSETLLWIRAPQNSLLPLLFFWTLLTLMPPGEVRGVATRKRP